MITYSDFQIKVKTASYLNQHVVTMSLVRVLLLVECDKMWISQNLTCCLAYVTGAFPLTGLACAGKVNDNKTTPNSVVKMGMGRESI